MHISVLQTLLKCILDMNVVSDTFFRMFAVYKYSSYLCIMKSSLRKTHNDVNAYGTAKSFCI